MNTNVLRAVFTRNFVSYFANPTGYVFICVFVLLSSLAAFWPYDFFNSNLANLDQLNFWFPFIMLAFIPAITMSIWAEERRQGTDELLLTIPASDFDIVLGKYLAAVTIFSVSLLFSLVTNACVLWWLGSPDVGLFLSTYVGYWLIGLAMLAAGMVASFLTGNLTVGYIFGAAFNAPLVFAAAADSVMGREIALMVKQWSIGGQFRDFGRGILNLSGLTYFATIVAVMLYLSMVFIGRRHWIRGREWCVLGTHYLLRTLALAAVSVAATSFFYHHDVRIDVTSEGLSRLSPESISLLGGVKQTLDKQQPKQTVLIDAFISRDVPEEYIQSRLNLLAKLREVESRLGGRVKLRLHEPRRFSPEAVRAKQRFGIVPRRVSSMSRGIFSQDYLFMGLAFTRGMESVIVPFLDRAVPAEYELVRSLCTVCEQKRLRIGIVQTGVLQRQWPIITELEKQYDVNFVDAQRPIPQRKQAKADDGQQKEAEDAADEEEEEEEGFDVLLVVQPSMLEQQPMDNLLAAIRRGQPTAIFEDPFPCFFPPNVAPVAPRPPPPNLPPQQMYSMMGSGMMEKNQIKGLWRLLGMSRFSGDDGVEGPPPMAGSDRPVTRADRAVWQDYIPYPKLPVPREYRELFVVIGEGCGAKEPFNQRNEITSGLQEVMFPCPGFIKTRRASNLEVTPLVRTGPESGYVKPYIRARSFFGPAQWVQNPFMRKFIGGTDGYILAAHIGGSPDSEPQGDDSNVEQKAPINVVLVADIDMLTPTFFHLRDTGEIAELDITLDLDNVTFILNVLDSLAADDRGLLAVRKRRPKHRELTRIMKRTAEARKKTNQARKKAQTDYDKALADANAELKQEITQLVKKFREDPDLDEDAANKEAKEALKFRQDQVNDLEKELGSKLKDEIDSIAGQEARDVQQLQDRYKLWAVLLPPIPPLLVAVGVFFTRRSREREGVSRNRLR